MKNIIFTLIFTITFFSLFAQPQHEIIIKKKNNDSIVDVDTLVGVRNSIIRVEYDTLFIINKTGLSEFVRCAGDLNKVKNLSGSLNSLTGDLSAIQVNVDSMYLNMKSVTAFVNKYERDTKMKLDQLSKDNSSLSKSMEVISKDLETTRQKLRAERWKSIGSKLLWGVGGFVAGGLLFTSLIMVH